MKQGRQRIDQLLVARNLAESREKAQALLLAGEVLVNGQKVTKAGAPVDETASIEVLARMPWVSRGGYKMLGALEHWGLDVTGRVCVDVGSSTGGFTDCLLQHGAARVHCVDVGAGQLHWKLRTDPRVVVHEGVNARYLEPALLGEPVGLAVCDVSFISVTLILPMLPPLLLPDGEIVVLVKPQFEVGRDQVGRGGIVRDPALHAAVCRKAEDAARMLGFQTSLMESPLPGAEGNKEFLLYGTGRHSRDHREA
jgi:23S rRNA (cytidine1920-2'-O)/16S rRNA (cytidine1409-2'-O)-methyltransferase